VNTGPEDLRNKPTQIFGVSTPVWWLVMFPSLAAAVLIPVMSFSLPPETRRADTASRLTPGRVVYAVGNTTTVWRHDGGEQHQILARVPDGTRFLVTDDDAPGRYGHRPVGVVVLDGEAKGARGLVGRFQLLPEHRP
jgi:hypothetical protein